LVVDCAVGWCGDAVWQIWVNGERGASCHRVIEDCGMMSEDYHTYVRRHAQWLLRRFCPVALAFAHDGLFVRSFVRGGLRNQEGAGIATLLLCNRGGPEDAK